MKAVNELSGPALVWTGNVMLVGRLALPPEPAGIAILAAAPGLPDEARDDQIVRDLYDSHIATLYVPLLTEDELQFDSRTGHFRLDAGFLAQRFVEIARWVSQDRETEGLPAAVIASSGAAAGALVAAAENPDLIATVVSIDGRTDLAVDSLRALTVPTLLVVKDMPVLRMNREALKQIHAGRRIEVVHGTDCHATDCVVEKTVHWLEEKLALVPA